MSYLVHCPRCNEVVGAVFSTEPLPGVYHEQCAEEEEAEEAEREDG